MQTADAYFLVHQYRGIYAGTLYCVERGHELVERIAELSRDLVPEFEVERARNMVADIEQQRRDGRGSSGGCRAPTSRKVLRLDPRAVVEPIEPDHLQITLIDPGPIAGGADADRHDQPAGDRLAAGDGPVGDGGDPPREDAADAAQRRASTASRPLSR